MRVAEEIKRILPSERDKPYRVALLKVLNANAGFSRRLNNQLLQESRLRNGVLVSGSVEISGDQVSVSGFAYAIEFEIFQPDPVTLSIPPADAFPRTDVIHGNASGAITYTPGSVDTAGNSLFPTIPQGDILLQKLTRNPDGAVETEPIGERDIRLTQEEYESILDIIRNGVEQYIHPTGFTDQPDIPEWLTTADVIAYNQRVQLDGGVIEVPLPIGAITKIKVNQEGHVIGVEVAPFSPELVSALPASSFITVNGEKKLLLDNPEIELVDVKEITGQRDELITANNDNLVAAINEAASWAQIDW